MSLTIDGNVYQYFNSLHPEITVTINDESPSYMTDYELPYTIVLTANDGYKITEVTGGGGYNPITGMFDPSFRVDETGKTATATFNRNGSDYNYNDFNVVTEVDNSAPSYDVTIEQSFIDSLGTEIIAKVDDVTIEVGSGLNYPFTMILTPSQPDIILVSSRGSYNPIEGMYQSFTISDDKKQMTYTFTNSDTFSNSWSFTTDIETPQVRGFNDIYLLEQSQVRTIIDTVFLTMQGNEPIDAREYILGLIDLPFNIPDDYKAGSKDITLGDTQTDVTATLLNDDQLTINMGSINVTSNENNSYDFMGVTCNLHLPFSDPLTIEPEYVINETVNIEYVINLINGTTFINIYSSKIDGIVLSRQLELNVSIPFRNDEIAPTNNNPSTVNYGNKNGVLTPFIEVLKNKTVLPYGFFTVPIIDETTLNNVSGYIEVENINLKGGILSDDYDNIVNLLNRGVIINV